MKIYFVGQKGIPAVYGGVEKHVEELTVRLVKAGHKVFVYVRPNYTNKFLKSYKGVNLISLPTIATKHLDAITHTFRACLDLIKRQVDIILFHSIGPSSLIWLAKLLKPGVPVVFTFHTKCYEHKKWGRLAKIYLKIAEAIACRLADKVIVVSPALVDYVKAKYNVKAVYIANGVSPAEIVKADKIKKWGLKQNNYILTVTRLVGHKGVQYLIGAYKKLKTKKKLVIVGAGAYTDNYVNELKGLAKSDKNIIFTGNQSGRELAELFSNAYLFVQPSESEGLSIALLEAMAYKNCALVSDIRENTDVIKNCGVQFKNKSVNSLRLKLAYLIKHPRLVEKYGAQAKIRVGRNYNWDKIAADTVRLYNEPVKAEKNLGYKKLNIIQKMASLLF